MDDEDIHDLIGVIYEAASAPERWGDIVRKIRLATHSHFGMLWLGNPNCSVEEFAANQGNFLAFEHENFSSLSDFEGFVLRRQDPSLTEPYAQLAHRVPLRRAVVGHEFVPIDEFKKTEFYHQVAAPAGNVHLLGSIMSRRNGRIDAITFYRPDKAWNYGPAELRLIDVFIPHIRRSLSLYKELQKAGLQAAVLQNSIDALTSALILLNHNGKVVFLNAAAGRLLERTRGLRVVRDRLCAARHVDTLQLERLIKEATGTNGRRPIGGAVTIQQAFGEQSLQVAAAPLPLDNEATLVSDLKAAALLIIHDPSEQSHVPQTLIRSMFGLTPAEARLLLAVSNGQSLKEYCDEHHVTHNTARTHLRTVFAKTSTSKQSDLVRLTSGLSHSVAMAEQ